jgi:hypothetical protein
MITEYNSNERSADRKKDGTSIRKYTTSGTQGTSQICIFREGRPKASCVRLSEPMLGCERVSRNALFGAKIRVKK